MPVTLNPSQMITVARLVACDERPTDEAIQMGVAEAFAEVEEPLGNDLRRWLERGLLRFEVVPIDAESIPSRQLLEYMGLGVEEGRRLDQARWMVQVRSGDMPHRRRSGFWAATLAARVLARMLDGVVVNPTRRWAEPLALVDQSPPAEGGVEAGQHIRIAHSDQKQGDQKQGDQKQGDQEQGHWMTTIGMPDFGLPNLEVREVPQPMVTRMSLLLIGAAQAVIDAHSDHTSQDEPLVLDILTLDAHTLLAAHGQGGSGDGEARFALEATPSDGTMEPFLRVRPANPDAEIGVWIARAHEALWGEASNEVLDISSDDEEMQAAKDRARSELDDLRSRFENGLGQGWQLYLKVGFDTPDGNVEYMWVGIEAWTGGLVQGILANEPQLVPELEEGQRVRVLQGQACDWLLSGPDGQQEGGYTVEVLKGRG